MPGKWKYNRTHNAQYRKYKRATDRVIDWLIDEGRRLNCPHVPAITDTARRIIQNRNRIPLDLKKLLLKRKYRKHHYLLEKPDFLPTAQFLVDHDDPPIEVPFSIQRDLDSAIWGRVKYADLALNPGHAAFVELLLAVQRVLEPRFKIWVPVKPAPPPRFILPTFNFFGVLDDEEDWEDVEDWHETDDGSAAASEEFKESDEPEISATTPVSTPALRSASHLAVKAKDDSNTDSDELPVEMTTSSTDGASAAETSRIEARDQADLPEWRQNARPNLGPLLWRPLPPRTQDRNITLPQRPRGPLPLGDDRRVPHRRTASHPEAGDLAVLEWHRDIRTPDNDRTAATTPRASQSEASGPEMPEWRRNVRPVGGVLDPRASRWGSLHGTVIWQGCRDRRPDREF